MALTAASITTGVDNGPTITSITTASVTPSANKTILFTVVCRRNDSISPPQPTISGLGLDWTVVKDVNVDTVATSMKRITTFKAVGNGSTGTITVDWGAGANITDSTWILDELTGDSRAIIQTTNSPINTSGTSTSATLSTFAAPINGTYFVGWNDTSFAITVPTSFTGVTTGTATVNGSLLKSGIYNGNMTSLTMTVSGSATNLAFLAFEIATGFVRMYANGAFQASRFIEGAIS